jgi:hypothetical protein
MFESLSIGMTPVLEQPTIKIVAKLAVINFIRFKSASLCIDF